MRKSLLLAVLFIGIASVSFFYSCSEKEDEELMIKSTVENTETVNQTLSSGSSCNTSCLFSDCKTKCTGSQTAYCECSWGFASCGCRSEGGNDTVEFLPSYSMHQVTLSISYRSFLSSNGHGDIANLVGDLMDNLEANDLEGYYSHLETYETTIEALPESQKNDIRNWLNSH